MSSSGGDQGTASKYRKDFEPVRGKIVPDSPAKFRPPKPKDSLKPPDDEYFLVAFLNSRIGPQELVGLSWQNLNGGCTNIDMPSLFGGWVKRYPGIDPRRFHTVEFLRNFIHIDTDNIYVNGLQLDPSDAYPID